MIKINKMIKINRIVLIKNIKIMKENINYNHLNNNQMNNNNKVLIILKKESKSQKEIFKIDQINIKIKINIIKHKIIKNNKKNNLD